MAEAVVMRQPSSDGAPVNPRTMHPAGESLEIGDVKPVVAAAVPVAQATAVPVPVAYATPVGGVDLTFLMPLNKLVINQHMKLAEMITSGCIEQANTYTVFNAETGRPVFIVQEESGDCTRCCCAPAHSFALKFLAINPDGSPGGVLMTMERAGNTLSNPCNKWLCCWNCADICADGFTLHAGDVSHPDGPGNFPTHNVIGRANQPSLGGGLTPTIQLMERNELAAFGIVEGPTLFGGCSELCCSAPFQISKGPAINLPLKKGDSAQIVKRAPTSFSGALREAVTDSDVYTMEFTDPNLNPYQKATELASLFLVDYMFFEQDNGMCKNEGGQTKITCCICYCYGCLCPCNVTLGKKNDN